ncbi:hypothetical protein ACWEP5_26305 [Nocardia niigatensis]
MSSQRPLSPFEVRHFDPEAKWGNAPKADCPLFVSSTVQVEFDTAWNSYAQMGPITDAMRAQVAALCAAAVVQG